MSTRPGCGSGSKSFEMLDPDRYGIPKTDPDPGIKSHSDSEPDLDIKPHFNLKTLSIKTYVNLISFKFFFR
jgi:hypothetical protein